MAKFTLTDGVSGGSRFKRQGGHKELCLLCIVSGVGVE